MPSLPATRQAAPVYLIVLREVVIAQDLSLTITDHDPEAVVLLATTSAEAEQMLAGVEALVLAFVVADPAVFASSGLARAIAARGGRAVLLGNEAEAHGPGEGWQVLDQPFNTDAVLAHLVNH